MSIELNHETDLLSYSLNNLSHTEVTALRKHLNSEPLSVLETQSISRISYALDNPKPLKNKKK